MRGTLELKGVGGGNKLIEFGFCFLAWFLHSCPSPFSSLAYINISRKRHESKIVCCVLNFFKPKDSLLLNYIDQIPLISIGTHQFCIY